MACGAGCRAVSGLEAADQSFVFAFGCVDTSRAAETTRAEPFDQEWHATSATMACRVLRRERETPMEQKHQPDPLTHDPAMLRALADEADGHR
jgi:hypothetical protein